MKVGMEPPATGDINYGFDAGNAKFIQMIYSTCTLLPPKRYDACELYNIDLAEPVKCSGPLTGQCLNESPPDISCQCQCGCKAALHPMCATDSDDGLLKCKRCFEGKCVAVLEGLFSLISLIHPFTGFFMHVFVYFVAWSNFRKDNEAAGKQIQCDLMLMFSNMSRFYQLVV